MRGDQVLVTTVWAAEHAAERMQGLLGRPVLKPGEAMLIQPCRLVHTFGMPYALDLAFLDRKGRVRKTVRAVKPARIAGCWTAHATLEMTAGEIDRLGIRPDDVLTWQIK
ncbi:DUF192 domain-containing protein [Chitinimonas sp. BJYL2]|uniref:DUF192 domain-containing protein n=1 Tax=Chitinimonas sp. BJYL2 TaxID=2976696 RepID=UPI0022B4FF74|nr:DUF192 domain-containing protein [Chitinimonas sp. BJYL2]